MAPSSVSVSPGSCRVTWATSASLESCSLESAENTPDFRRASGCMAPRIFPHLFARAEVTLLPYAAEVVQGDHSRRALLPSVRSPHLRPEKERASLGAGRGRRIAGPRVPQVSIGGTRVGPVVGRMRQLWKYPPEHRPRSGDLPPVRPHLPGLVIRHYSYSYASRRM